MNKDVLSLVKAGSESGFRHVYKDAKPNAARPWRARIRRGNTNINLGRYATPIAAAKAVLNALPSS